MGEALPRKLEGMIFINRSVVLKAVRSKPSFLEDKLSWIPTEALMD